MVADSIFRTFRDWQARSRVRSELQAMSDRQLSDIGINRGEIDSVVRGDYVRQNAHTA